MVVPNLDFANGEMVKNNVDDSVPSRNTLKCHKLAGLRLNYCMALLYPAS